VSQPLSGGGQVVGVDGAGVSMPAAASTAPALRWFVAHVTAQGNVTADYLGAEPVANVSFGAELPARVDEHAKVGRCTLKRLDSRIYRVWFLLALAIKLELYDKLL